MGACDASYDCVFQREDAAGKVSASIKHTDRTCYNIALETNSTSAPEYSSLGQLALQGRSSFAQE